MVKAKLSPEQQAELAVSLGFCLECGGKLCRTLEGENVCTRCGLVWGSQNISASVPFPESEEQRDYEGHWQPSNSLAFLKALGDPALDNSGRGGLMRVLALSCNGPADLGLRANQIKLMIYREEPIQLRNILRRIALLLDRLGLRENHEIANYTGNLARKLVAFCLTAQTCIPKSLADAIVKHAAAKFQLNPTIALNCKPEELKLVEWLEKSIEKLKLKPKSTQKNSPINSNK